MQALTSTFEITGLKAAIKRVQWTKTLIIHLPGRNYEMPVLIILINICVLVWLIMLFVRLVKAVEHIADKTDRTSQMLEKMVDKLQGQPGNLPPAE
jgi:hypothetical protein